MTVLQSRLSGMFFKDFGQWVARATEAIQFGTTERARAFIRQERVADVAVRDLSETVEEHAAQERA